MKIKKVNFSNKYATGSIEARKKTMEQLRSEIYSAVMKEFSPVRISKNLSVERTGIILPKLEKILKENLPEKINFCIAKKDPRKIYDGCILTELDRKKVINYRMELPIENKELSVFKIPTFMHEVTHLLDFALNSQYKVVVEHLKEAEISGEAYSLYKECFYTKHAEAFDPKILTKKTNEFLKGYTTEEKLLILRYIKLLMITEVNAFNATKKYSEDLLKKVNYFPTKWPKLPDYHFSEKIKSVDEMRLKIIKKERNRQKQPAFYKKLSAFFCKKD